MTGMEHAIEHAAKTLWDYDNADQTPEWRDMAWNDMGGSEPCVERAEYELRARALADAGLLAPSPLTEEWGTRFGSSEYVHFGTGVEYPFFFRGDPPKGVNVRRCVTDWTPVDRAEGDGRADRPSWVDEHGINHADGDGGRW